MSVPRGKDDRPRFPVLIVVAIAVSATFIISFFPGQSGIIRLRQLEGEYDRMLRQNYRMVLENKKLAGEIRSLRHDPASIEKIAREELHFVSPGDVVLIVPR